MMRGMTTRRALLRMAMTVSGLGGIGATLAGCGPSTSAPASSATRDGSGADLAPEVRALLASHGVEATTAEEAVTALDQVPEPRPLDLTGSVHHDRVVFVDASQEVEAALTGGEFYLSLAPYRTQTHECSVHSLGGCQGELVDTPVHVAVDGDDGERLVDEDVSTYANGFVGFWIPRDLTGIVTVSVGAEAATTPFDSGPEGPTCLTMLQLR